MGKAFNFMDSCGEKAMQAFLLEKRLEQQQKSKLDLIQKARSVRLRDIDADADGLKNELATYRKGITNLSSYFEKEKTGTDNDIIWYPLIRTKEDWKPQPCWIRQSAVHSDKCPHFPCRTLTSYHFIFRQLPQFINDRAEESVRRSKVEISSISDNLHADGESISKCSTKLKTKMPPVEFPDDMTIEERKLKVIIAKKRFQNELENKPKDRNINYGSPTSVRRLQRPVRPVVRRMDIRL